MELLRFAFGDDRLSVRDMVEDDIEGFVSYWHDGVADLDFLGIDPVRLGGRDDTRARFRRFCRRDGGRDEAVGFTFVRDGTVIGYTNINIFGRPKGYVHVHLTDPSARRRGILSAILWHSLPVLADHVFTEYPIDGLVLETRTRNVGINRVVQSIGLLPRATVHLDDPDGLAGPGEFSIYDLDPLVIKALLTDHHALPEHTGGSL
ncbi:GNAT family N-acetyltransferase [Actinomadura scrupuli]|uniref:GNAT family N-acetyltransferase n=1 Tax=Actinomadura scrupuli TaxID=559629 RepID=UPI003D995FA9